jgi:hypothetical protein
MRLRELAERQDGAFQVRMLVDADAGVDGLPIVITIRNRQTLQRVVFRVRGEDAARAFHHPLAICPEDLFRRVAEEAAGSIAVG